jgi:guanylate kinase
LEIDLQGCRKVFESGIPAHYLFLLPPNFDVLRDRLIKRGTETADQIENRLNIGKNEIEELKNCPFIDKKFVNEDLEKCYSDVVGWLKEIYGEDIVKHND